MPEFTVNRLGHLGDGVIDSNNGPIFAPFTLPGEVISGEPEGDRIVAPRIVTPSSDRIKPPCPHFKTCGGCALQHASDEFLANWKTDIVRSALSQRGIDPEFRPIMVSPSASRRRATLAGQRTKKGAMVGFHARASQSIVEIASCTLLEPAIPANLPVFEILTRMGATRKTTISISVTTSIAGLDIVVLDAKPADHNLLAELGRLTELHQLARLSWNGDVVALRTDPVQQFGKTTVTPPPEAFLQATIAGQAALISAVKNAIGEASRIADLFAGCGTFTLPLAEKVEMLAVEAEPAQLAALDAGWRRGTELRTVRTEARDLFRRPLDADELGRFDAIVIDPPRAGALEQARYLAASKVKRIAFVSCNPITFARDAALLIEGGYTLEWVQVVDQFRWSAHVELVGFFQRR